MDFMLEPFLLSLVAGTATDIGGVVALMLRKVSDRVVGFSMGFASGVMILVSFNNLFLEAVTLLTHFELIATFSLGALIMIALDLTLPHIELTTRKKGGENAKMLRTAALVAIGITLHNLPEGLIVTAGYTHMPRLGLIITIAIMLHNLPEGAATAIPCLAAGVKPSKIVALTFLSGLSEPVGALLGIVAYPLV